MILLIISGPANAFILQLTIGEQYVKLGDKTTFTVSSVVDSGEELNIQKFVIKLIGPKNVYCEFLPDGTPIYDCEGMNITLLSEGNKTADGATYDYGYQGYGGYGYNYAYGYIFGKGILSYNITIDTSEYPRGLYSTEFDMIVDEKVYKEEGKVLFIYDKDGLKGCSIRAHKGEIEERTTGNYSSLRNRLSLTIPLKNAAPGQGVLQTQSSKTRLIYDFEVLGLLESTPLTSKILIKGTYRTERNSINNTKEETAIIYLDKKNKLLNLAGKSITAQNMNVNLMQGC